MRRLVLPIFGLLALLLSSCGSPVEGSPQQGSTSGFNLVFKYGVGGAPTKNVLETARGTFTRDMILDPPVTVKLKLSEDDLKRIRDKMDEIHFWDYPDVLGYEPPPGGLTRMVTPYPSYYFRAERGGVVKELRWDDQHADESERAVKLRDLTVLIREIVESKPGYEELPEPRGGYM